MLSKLDESILKVWFRASLMGWIQQGTMAIHMNTLSNLYKAVASIKERATLDGCVSTKAPMPPIATCTICNNVNPNKSYWFDPSNPKSRLVEN